MSLSRKILLAIALVILLMTASLLTLGRLGKEAVQPPASSQSASTDFPIASTDQQAGSSARPGSGKYRIFPSESTGKSVISTPNGEKIEISDPEKIAQEKIDEKGYLLKGNSAYDMLYYKYSEGPSFLITLLSDNLEPTRAAAETEFLSTLGISKEQACKLLVSLTIPGDVNESLSGDDYHLSFCPDGKPLK